MYLKTTIFAILAGIVSASMTTRNLSVEPGPGKYALIIAIGSYDRATTGWPSISSANDVPLIVGSLLKLGFEDSGINLLRDQSATRKGILDAIEDLRQKASAGSMIVVHVSSHGQQIFDNNNEEVDDLDEAIVPYGAPVSDKKFREQNNGKGYDGNLHLRDDDFGNAINQLRAKIGPQGHVLVVMDNCHSGTGTRGTAPVRGGEPPLIPEGWDGAQEAEPANGTPGFYSENSDSPDSMGKLVVISGASAHELNYETKDDDGNNVGSLSYCFSKSVQGLPKNSTYRELFAAIKTEMALKAERQKPQIEGDVDFVIFDGKYVAQERYLTIRELGAKQIRLNAGKLQGIYNGTRVSVEKAGSQGAGKSTLSTGVVTESENLESVVVLDKPLTITRAVDAWVFVTSRPIPEVRVRADVSTIKDLQLKQAVIDSLSALGMAEVTGDDPDVIIQSLDGPANTFTLELVNRSYNSVIQKFTASSRTEASSKARDIIHNYAQGKMFKSLDLYNPDRKVVITRMIPVRAGSRELRDSLSYGESMDEGGFTNIKEGTTVFLELENLSEKTTFFNVIDLQPDGVINPLLPMPRRGTLIPDPVELRLGPREKKVLKYAIRIAPPYGNEVFKVISTSAPFDLSSTINTKGTRGTRGDGPKSAIQQLLGNSYSGKFSTRGATVDDTSSESTSEFVFRIVER